MPRGIARRIAQPGRLTTGSEPTPPRLVAIVLAAGASSRFGSSKLLADLEGRPVLQHVLDTLSDAGLGEVVVVLGGPSADDVEGRIQWRAERRVRNANPERGLSSSVREGIAALPPDADAALVVLGDQPRLRADVIQELISTWQAGSRPIVAPRYSGSGTLNPVLLARAAWPRAASLEGDRGFGPLIHGAPEVVTRVDIAGDNPDVDTPEDLARLTEAGEEPT